MRPLLEDRSATGGELETLLGVAHTAVKLKALVIGGVVGLLVLLLAMVALGLLMLGGGPSSSLAQFGAVVCTGAGDVVFTTDVGVQSISGHGAEFRNAGVITHVTRAYGAARGWSEQQITRAQVIAVDVALAESDLRNVAYGDRDSLGLFQQRPSQGWGRPTQAMEPPEATRRFLDVLAAVPGWDSLPITTVTWQVQHYQAGLGYRYAAREGAADAIVATLTGAECTATEGGLVLAGSGVQAVLGAQRWLGVPYVWGGGRPGGPSPGLFTGQAGYDCSSLVQAAWWPYRRLPRVAADQYAATADRSVPLDQLRPGDLVFWSRSGAAGIHHVALYAGNGQILEAPHTGARIRLAAFNPADPRLFAATRPG